MSLWLVGQASWPVQDRPGLSKSRNKCRDGWLESLRHKVPSHSLLLAAALLWPLAAQDTATVCAPCHVEQLNDWRTHKHAAKSVACQVCHGASLPHRNAVGATAPDRVAAPDEVPELCGSCHLTQRKEYEPSKHGKLVLARSKTRAPNCATCHGVHASRDAVQMKRQCDRCHAALPLVCQRKVEVNAAKLNCVSCHAPHTLARQ